MYIYGKYNIAHTHKNSISNFTTTLYFELCTFLAHKTSELSTFYVGTDLSNQDMGT